MTTELVLHGEHGLGLEKLGQVFVASGYFKDVKSAAASITKVLAGRELGIGPFAAQTSLHIIEGKPVLSANLLAAAIKRSGKYTYRVKRLDDTGCEIIFLERNRDKWEEIGVSAFTEKEAKAAGLLMKDNWKKYGKAMYFARAISQGQRWHCPDVFSGASVYTPDEMEMSVNSDGEAINVTVVEPVSVAAPAHTIPQTAKPVSGPAQTATAAPMHADEQRGIVDDVDSRDGGTEEKPWTKYGVKIGGKFYGTFDHTLGSSAQDWIGQEVYFTSKPSKNPKYTDLVSIRRVDDDADVSYEENGQFLFGTDQQEA